MSASPAPVGVRSAGPASTVPRLAEPAAAAALAIAALAIAAYAGVKGLSAVPDVARVVLAALALLTVSGYAPARLLVPRDLWPHFWVFVLLAGCATAGLALTFLGFLGLPFAVSVALLAGAGAVAAVALRLRLGPARPSAEDSAAAGGWRCRFLWPGHLGVLVAALLLLPVLSSGYATVQGANPDAMLGVGAAEFLQHAYPTSVDSDLPVDQMPLVWRSKYPIYYTLAAASSLSGLDATEAIAAFSAVLGALTAAGFMVLARYGLGAGPRGALLVMGVVGLDRVVAYLALHPYFNQLWGTLALAPILLFGLRLLRRPSRPVAVLFSGFLVIGLAAYPLMVLFPALALLGGALASYRAGHIRPRRPRLPRTMAGRIGWAAVAVVAAPAALVVGLGVAEKTGSAAKLLFTGGSLAPWQGDLSFYRPPGFFVGVGGPAGYVVAALALLAAVLAVRRLEPVARGAFVAMIAGGAFFGLYFRLRHFGEYFYFKVLAFLAPVVLVAAAVWLATRVARGGTAGRIAAGAAVIVVALQLQGLRREVFTTGLQLDSDTISLRQAAARLPDGASLRLDVIDDGRQLWAGYVLSDNPLSTLRPLLGTTYPHPRVGRKADFVVADTRLGPAPPPDAVGGPLYSNAKFRVYRMDEDVPGPDVSSKRMVDTFSETFR